MTTLTLTRRDTVDHDYAAGFYRRGCEVNPVPLGCLTCPLPICKYDLPNPEEHRRREQAKVTRAGVIALLNQGLMVAEIAMRLGVSGRTVSRYKAEIRWGRRHVA